MVAKFFEAIAATVTGYITAFTGGVNAVVTLFWDSTLNTGTGGFTPVGLLALIGIGVGLASLAIAWLSSLIKK